MEGPLAERLRDAMLDTRVCLFVHNAAVACSDRVSEEEGSGEMGEQWESFKCWVEWAAVPARELHQTGASGVMSEGPRTYRGGASLDNSHSQLGSNYGTWKAQEAGLTLSEGQGSIKLPM